MVETTWHRCGEVVALGMGSIARDRSNAEIGGGDPLARLDHVHVSETAKV